MGDGNYCCCCISGNPANDADKTAPTVPTKKSKLMTLGAQSAVFPENKFIYNDASRIVHSRTRRLGFLAERFMTNV